MRAGHATALSNDRAEALVSGDLMLEGDYDYVANGFIVSSMLSRYLCEAA